MNFSDSFCKLNPSRSMYLRGFDRRGCAASLNSVTDTSFQVSGLFSDQADFVVLMLFDADDIYGHLTTSRYLPDFSLENVTLSFDLSTSGCFNPTSPKFQSVPWKSLSYIRNDGSSGTVLLTPYISVNSGGSYASITYTLSGTPTTYDRILIIYLSNIIFDSASFGITTGMSLAQVAIAMVALVNSYSYSPQVPLTAVVDPFDPNSFIISYGDIGVEGNSIALMCETRSGNVISITPTGESYLEEGTSPFSIHFDIPFSSLVGDSDTLPLGNIRQLWFTIAPQLPLGENTTYTQSEFSWSVTNWTISDPNNQLPLYISGPLSTLIDSTDVSVVYTGTWASEAGFFCGGFAQVASANASTVTIVYTNTSLHDIYLGTSLYSDRGTFSITVDSISYGTIDMELGVAALLNTRRLIAENISAGTHTVVLTTTSSSPCYFDFLQAVVKATPVEPTQVYENLSAAFDFDTDQTYKLSPNRSLFILRQLGLRGNIDIYSGVFFKEVRQRNGGLFNVAQVSFAGTWNTGTDFGDGDQLFIDLSGTIFGVSVYVQDTNLTIAQRFANFINAGFVGVAATAILDTGVGYLTITELTPINAFTISISTSTSPGGTMLLDLVPAPASTTINAGNEGTWEISTFNTNDLTSFPLNKGFMDWLVSFRAEADRYGLAFTLAFSQEILQPPDVNTVDGAWSQRYNDGTPVLTDTGFGSWGTGYIQSYSVTGGVTTIEVLGHGFITGNTATISITDPLFTPNPTAVVGSYIVTVIDANHFSIPATPTLVDGYQVYINLLTTQCTFNPNTVTPYMASQYKQALPYVNFFQFGEILWWFFAGGAGPSQAYYDAYTTNTFYTLFGRNLATFAGPTASPSINSYEDVDFLVAQLVAHIHTIREAVLSIAGARSILFEWLCPYDVNWPSNYTNVQYPYDIGGEMNNYVNIPKRYLLGPGDDIDIMKMEALAWGTSYRTLDNAEVSITFPFTNGLWLPKRVNYLVPVQNGGCPWVQELNLAIDAEINSVNLWAIDHIILFSWPFPMSFIGILIDNGTFLPITTSTLGYYRTFLNDPITTPSPNNEGAIGGEQ